MKYSIHSNPFKKGVQIVLALLLGVALLGSNAVYAHGLCVQPTGPGNCFTSIQAAVDAANDGDQIIIRPGIYVEQILIVGKNISLIGRRGAVIQAPEVMEQVGSPVDEWFVISPIILASEAEVNIRDLIIDGMNSAAMHPYLDGILFLNAGGTIHGNVVKNIGFGTPTLPDDWSYQGQGIEVANYGDTPRTVNIDENFVVNYNAAGIVIFAETPQDDPTPAVLNVNVVRNIVIGSGSNNALSQWGIFFGGYNSSEVTGSLKNNWIRDLVTIDQNPAPGIGITTKDMLNVEVSGNVFENVDMGLTVSGTGTQVLENRFKNASSGILLFVDFPGYGNAVGTVIDNNKFDKVYMDIMTGPVMMYEAAAKLTSETLSEPAQEQHKRLPR